MMPDADGVGILGNLERRRFQRRVGSISSADNEPLKAAVVPARGYGLKVLGNLVKLLNGSRWPLGELTSPPAAQAVYPFNPPESRETTSSNDDIRPTPLPFERSSV